MFHHQLELLSIMLDAAHVTGVSLIQTLHQVSQPVPDLICRETEKLSILGTFGGTSIDRGNFFRAIHVGASLIVQVLEIIS